ncbi:MAG TPA: flavodoxin domain-containing protein [Anaerolinea sp.]|nr:flavodoxin domain-containing protein [Anaerolinea sp.]
MQPKPVTRRTFLKTAGLTLAAVTVTCSGLGVAATLQPSIDLVDNSYGENNMNNPRILVTYATRAGSTAEVAAAIGETLGKRGFTVDVRPVKENPNVNDYQAVIMGSAIRMGSWLPEAMEFVKNNQAALAGKQTALFCVHMLNDGEDEAGRSARLSYLNAVRGLLNGAEEAYFTGKFDFSRLSFLDRMISKMVKAVEGDHRDWNKINAWANTLLA